MEALFLLTGSAETLDPSARSALRKLVQALPQAFRAQAQAAAAAFVVDSTPWGHGDRPRTKRVDELQAAVVTRRKISLEYESRSHKRTRRVVDPWGLISKDDVWYLVAGTEAGQRTFRIDRIVAATVTDLVAERPGDFDLSLEWKRVVDEVEERRAPFSATVLVDAAVLPVLRKQFGRHCDTLGTHDDGRARVRVAAPMALSIAEHLAGWGGVVEVLEPDSVKAELARLGAELVQRYTSK